MTPDEIRILKSRLDEKWLVNKTDIFDDEDGIPAVIFAEYWRIWIRDDVRRLFEYVETLEKSLAKEKDHVRDLQLELDNFEDRYRRPS
jgi:hypothetical protein